MSYSDDIWRLTSLTPLICIIACRMLGAKQLPEPILAYSHLLFNKCTCQMQFLVIVSKVSTNKKMRYICVIYQRLILCQAIENGVRYNGMCLLARVILIGVRPCWIFYGKSSLVTNSTSFCVIFNSTAGNVNRRSHHNINTIFLAMRCPF